MKKLLVIGIIALFIGLAFIPSFNAVSISKDIEETNTTVDDDEKNCEYKLIDRIQLVRLKRISILLDILSNRLEEVSNIIPLSFKHNKEIEEIYIDISERILTFEEINKELKLKLLSADDDYNTFICGVLLLMALSWLGLAKSLMYLFEQFPILEKFVYPLVIPAFLSTLVVIYVGIIHYECIDPVPPY
jgi:hypothetical protein